MTMKDFCMALQMDVETSASAPEGESARGHTSIEDGDMQSVIEVESGAAGGAAASVVSVHSQDSEEERPPAWQPKDYNKVLKGEGEFAHCMSMTEHYKTMWVGEYGPLDDSLAQPMHHTISLAKKLIPDAAHRLVLSNVALVYMGASSPRHRVKEIMCKLHLRPFSPPYVSSRDGAVPHRFCFKRAADTWEEGCVKMRELCAQLILQTVLKLTISL
jgi:hypothetical protein